MLLAPLGTRAGSYRPGGRRLLDYSRTPFVARGIRDELRLVRPGLYLGRAHWHGIRITDFALEA